MEGSFTTLQFSVQEVNRKINNQKDYEYHPNIMNGLIN